MCVMMKFLGLNKLQDWLWMFVDAWISCAFDLIWWYDVLCVYYEYVQQVFKFYRYLIFMHIDRIFQSWDLAHAW
jgi:hypothetical protein